ncbi:unnamed protein product [Colias eurytheme]|nr:unnamed protein product [Colias eurytheme]
MLTIFVFILCVAPCTFARPNYQETLGTSNDDRNVIQVPDNCKDGQVLVNGVCRDIWRRFDTAESLPSNVITVPDNCPPGQELVNGVCRDIWRILLRTEGVPSNVISVPDNCPPGQKLVNGVCRNIWRSNILKQSQRRQIDGIILSEINFGVGNKNIISVPSQCPSGYRPDANGICRPILD